MATDWARYLYDNKDVYSMYSDGGKWSWDRGRQQNAYMRMDGSPLQQESAAQYAQNHYRNFGKREGRQLHDTGSTDYAALLRSGGGGASAPQNNPMSALQKQVADLTASLQDGAGELGESVVADASQALNSTILNAISGEEAKKRKSFLTPYGA